MDIRLFIDKVMESSKKKGIEESELYYSDGESFTVKVFEGDISDYKVSEARGISLRGLYHGKMGYSYTEIFDDKSVNLLTDEVIESAEIIDSGDEEIIFEGSESYRELKLYNEDYTKVCIEEKIEFIKKLENACMEIDPRVHKVDYCIFGDGIGERIIKNSKGLELSQKGNSAYAYVSVVVRENDETKTGSAYKISNDFSEFNVDELAKKAVEEAISMLGAKPISSGEYRIVMKNKTFASLIQSYSGLFSAENVQKGMSQLKGKLGHTLASEKFTLVDDPFLENGTSSRSFDDEGVATEYRKIVENGVLKTYLYNLKTAKKDGVKTTGNATKASYKGTMGISPSNFYLEKGNFDFKTLLEKLSDGLYITQLDGLHAGINKISGDFSLAARGYYVRNGQIERPVNQITVAGNYFEMLKSIEEIGDDLEFTMSSVGSPSVLIKSLNISGD